MTGGIEQRRTGARGYNHPGQSQAKASLTLLAVIMFIVILLFLL